MMWVPPLLLLLLFWFLSDPTEAIRPLKEGPMIDSEGREYKSALSGLDAESFGEPRPAEGSGAGIRVECTGTSVTVLPKADLLQNGHRVSPGEILLGGVDRPECRAAPAGNAEYVIEAGLQDCGSELTVSEDGVLYSNKLIYSPTANRRRARLVIPLFCQFRDKIGSHTQQMPPPPPQRRSAFSLQLMTDDWTAETSSSVFYMGDLLHLQVSHVAPNRGGGGGRVLVDSCVATLTPDVTSVPRYYFIQNYGCLVDSKEQGSKAVFLPRTRADVLQLQLDAFLFRQDPRTSIFITCQLRASAEMQRSSQTNKACSYQHMRWENVDGSNHVCSCCASTCDESSLKESEMAVARRRTPAGTPDTPPPHTCDTLMLGPLTILPRK